MSAPRRRDAPPPLAAIIGPTAVGKSELAIAVAERLGAEIVSADSRQVYRGMDIATAKVPPAERRDIPHHLIDVADPDATFTLADWLRLARSAIHEIGARGRLPLIVGGTGLYLSALVDGYRLGGPGPVPELRHELLQQLETEGLEAVAGRLREVSPETAQRVDLRNPRRVVRGLERILTAGGGGEGLPAAEPYAARTALVALRRPTEVLGERIDIRVREQFAGGLLEETQRLLDVGYDAGLPSMSGIGYREAARHLAGEWSLPDAVAATERRTRQYAKRQMTWFRGRPDLIWVELGRRPSDDPAAVDEVAGLIYRCLA